MTPQELESKLLQQQQDIEQLQSKVAGLQKQIDALLSMKEKQAAHDATMADREFLHQWKLRAQSETVRELLFEFLEQQGLSKEQMEAEYNRRWKKRLDDRLQRLEDTEPNLAGRVDERSANDIPLD